MSTYGFPSTLSVGDLATIYQNGTTSITKLAVGDSTVAAAGQINMYIGKNSSANNGFFLNHNHIADGSSSNYFKILGYGQGVAGFCVRSDGNVGMGTTNPGAPVVGVSTSATPSNAGIAQFLAPNITNGYQARICLGQHGGSDSATPSDGAYINYTNYSSAGASKNTFSIGFTQGAADVFFVQSSGNVGIGTSNPVLPLAIYNTGGHTTSYTPYFQLQNSPNGSAGSTAAMYMKSDYLGFDVSDNVNNTSANKKPVVFGEYGGNVGIGIISPSCPLSVGTSASIAVTSGYYFDNAHSTLLVLSASNQNASIFAQNWVVSAQGFMAYSDARIKMEENITQPIFGIIDNLTLRKYSYIDKKNLGSSSKYGFFAQEVEEVAPELVNITSDFIPSVYKVAENVSSNVFTLTNHGLEEGDLVKFYKFDNSSFESIIYNVTPNTFTLSETFSENSVFIYGKKVNDFRQLDYDQMACLAIGAIQKLSAKNADLESRLETAQNNIDLLETRLAAIESRLLA